MNGEKNSISWFKKELDEEMKDICFTTDMKKDVLCSIHEKGKKTWFDREVGIPRAAAIVICLLLCISFFLYTKTFFYVSEAEVLVFRREAPINPEKAQEHWIAGTAAWK